MRSERNAFADRIRRLENERAEAHAALSALLRLFCEDNHAEHTETIAAVRILEAAGRAEVTRDGGDWIEFRLID